jgi:GNAT superfamily N-acetyltransferase
MKIEIIPADESHRPFITDAFVRRFSRAPQCAGVSGTVVSTLLEPLLNDWHALVAVPDGDRDTLLGYVVYEPRRAGKANPVIAWVYVVETWTRKGIGRALLFATGLRLGTQGEPLEVHSPFTAQKVSEDGPSISALCEKHGLVFRYRPYLPLQVQLDALTREAAA